MDQVALRMIVKQLVTVPDTNNPLQPHIFQVLQQEIQPLEATWDNIVQIYAATRVFIQMCGDES